MEILANPLVLKHATWQQEKDFFFKCAVEWHLQKQNDLRVLLAAPREETTSRPASTENTKQMTFEEFYYHFKETKKIEAFETRVVRAISEYFGLPVENIYCGGPFTL